MRYDTGTRVYHELRGYGTILRNAYMRNAEVLFDDDRGMRNPCIVPLDHLIILKPIPEPKPPAKKSQSRVARTFDWALGIIGGALVLTGYVFGALFVIPGLYLLGASEYERRSEWKNFPP